MGIKSVFELIGEHWFNMNIKPLLEEQEIREFLLKEARRKKGEEDESI